MAFVLFTMFIFVAVLAMGLHYGRLLERAYLERKYVVIPKDD